MTDEQIVKALRCWTGKTVKDEECAECSFGEDCFLGEIVDAAEKRLNELKSENAALRERLKKAVELKAKRLDVIYMPWVYDGNFGIATLQIIGIDLRTNGEIAYITNLESDSIIYLAKYSYGIFYNADFDHIVFTDRSKAEVRLAELKGGAK